jgi:hypothetical protein
VKLVKVTEMFQLSFDDWLGEHQFPRELVIDVAEGNSNWESKTVFVPPVMSEDKPKLTEQLSMLVQEFIEAMPDEPPIADPGKCQDAEQTPTKSPQWNKYQSLP